MTHQKIFQGVFCTSQLAHHYPPKRLCIFLATSQQRLPKVSADHIPIYLYKEIYALQFCCYGLQQVRYLRRAPLSHINNHTTRSVKYHIQCIYEAEYERTTTFHNASLHTHFTCIYLLFSVHWQGTYIFKYYTITLDGKSKYKHTGRHKANVRADTSHASFCR